ncbi:unnamed protein product [Cylindrotheca closterium]|uniref:Uncharacterized protein n=1 Tax=Cylindrotheca closterium TaxID=2856 RepID=A0AAD2JJR1_9STRA|nr:unnamed protein product [Cylindrotheca closterium]
MSALRQLKKGVTKGVAHTTRFAQGAADLVKDGTTDIIKGARDGIREGLSDEKSKELKRSNSANFYEESDDDDDPDISSMRYSTVVGSGGAKKKKDDQNMAGYSIRPPNHAHHDNTGADSDDDLYTEPLSESQQGELGLNDDDDDSAVATKKKKKIKKIKYRKSGDDSDGSDASAKSTKSSKSSKSSKSGKSRKKKKDRVKRSDGSVGSGRKKKAKDRDESPTRQTSNASLKSETSFKKKKKKKMEVADAYSSDDHDDEQLDELAPLPGGKKVPVLPVRSKSPSGSPGTKKKSPAAPVSPTSDDAVPVHPIKQELMRFSDIWKTQTEDDTEEASPQKRESLNVGRISAALGELNGEIKEDDEDHYSNDFLDAKLRSTEQKLHDSEGKVEELIIAKNEIQKELDEEQLRNDELSRKLLFLEDRVEELEQEKKELEDNPKVIEHEADPIEIFELQQEINTLKTDMSIKVDQHAEALHSKNETIKELEAKLEAGGGAAQPRDSLHSSMHSTNSAGGDAKTQGLLLRSNDRIQKQEAEIKELKQKLEQLGNAEIIEQKDEEIKNLGVQIFELETKMKNMETEQQKALKQKEETIVFFQNQVVEMLKKMPKQAAYTRKKSTEPGEEGTMTLDGEAPEEEATGLWGLVSRASPGLLGGRQTVDRRKMKDVPPSPQL